MMLWYTITWYIPKISRSHTLNLHNSLELDKNVQCGFIVTCFSELSEIVLTFLSTKLTFLANCFSWLQFLDSSFRVTLHIPKTVENSDIIKCKPMQNHAVKQRVWKDSFFFSLIGKIYRRQIQYHVWPLTPKIISAPKWAGVKQQRLQLRWQ